MTRAFFTAVAGLLVTAGLASGQNSGSGALRVELGVEPQSVTVGEPFHSAMRVIAPEGFRLEYADFVSGDSLQSTAPVRVTAEEGERGVAIYDLVSWVAGSLPDASVIVRVIDGDGNTTVHEIELALPEVVSVLPDPPAPVEPRPAKGLVVPPTEWRLPWWWLAIILAAIITAILAYRRLSRGDQAEEAMDPREWAFAQLASIDQADRSTREAIEEVYRRSSWVLRRYLARLDQRLGPDLTTGEIDRRMVEIGADSGTVRSLRTLLDAADRVKFAAHGASAADSAEAIAATRDWVAEYPPVVIEEKGTQRAA